ncbi:GFA family protein [Chitinimonas sp. DQS-5]|uniref:GFA family protein n=2 Tax=Parachitinimonas caeni TaxID=3031301 RepID=A0ABT7E0W3_9NEIS|nr:GFA family protein [Parachitinimonas caeni]
MQEFTGSCHCGAIRFTFRAAAIDKGLRCNCSICRRKGALMSAFTVAAEDLAIDAANDALATYHFGTGKAHHHFCKHCGIYPFHQTMRKPGHYRINLGCVEGVDSCALPFEVYDGASL